MRIILVLLALTATAQAQGMSYLGMCHAKWNCEATMRTWSGKDKIVTGWLEQTFGEDCKCADRILHDKRDKVIRVHLLNSVCMRNKRCGRYEPLYGYTPASASRAILRGDKRLLRKYDRLLLRLKARLEKSKGAVQCYVSPCLECDLNERARRTLLNRAAIVLPYCSLVDNPLRAKCIKGYICEKHGERPNVTRPCIVDLDGTDGRQVNLKEFAKRYRACDIRYYWEPFMNCIKGSFVDPRSRKCDFGVDLFTKTRRLICQYFSHPSSGTCSR